MPKNERRNIDNIKAELCRQIADLDPSGLYLLCSFLDDPGAALPIVNPVSCEACRDTFTGCDPEACRVRFVKFCDQITPGDSLHLSRNVINRDCKVLESRG
nr:MAG TPA: hypothetical protein [Caudoviricetes sp.]